MLVKIGKFLNKNKIKLEFLEDSFLIPAQNCSLVVCEIY